MSVLRQQTFDVHRGVSTRRRPVRSIWTLPRRPSVLYLQASHILCSHAFGFSRFQLMPVQGQYKMGVSRVSPDDTPARLIWKLCLRWRRLHQETKQKKLESAKCVLETMNKKAFDTTTYTKNYMCVCVVCSIVENTTPLSLSPHTPPPWTVKWKK